METDFSVSDRYLLPGLNTLRFTVHDIGGVSGFRAEFTSATAERIPDRGSTLALLATALGVLGVFSFYRRTIVLTAA